MAERFVTKTRKRGEVDYYFAIWQEYPKARGGYAVKLVEGPHKDEKYEAIYAARQAEVLEKLRQRCYCAEFAIGFDEAKKIIDEYLGCKNEEA